MSAFVLSNSLRCLCCWQQKAPHSSAKRGGWWGMTIMTHFALFSTKLIVFSSISYIFIKIEIFVKKFNSMLDQETQFDLICAKAEWSSNSQMCFEEEIFFDSSAHLWKGPWFFMEKDLQKIVSLVKEKLVVVIDRVRYLPLCPEPKGQFTPIIFFLTNPGTPREKKGQKLLLKF